MLKSGAANTLLLSCLKYDLWYSHGQLEVWTAAVRTCFVFFFVCGAGISTTAENRQRSMENNVRLHRNCCHSLRGHHTKSGRKMPPRPGTGSWSSSITFHLQAPMPPLHLELYTKGVQPELVTCQIGALGGGTPQNKICRIPITLKHSSFWIGKKIKTK